MTERRRGSRLDDGIADDRVHFAGRHVVLGGALLEDAKRSNDRLRHHSRRPTDWKILERTLRLCSPQHIVGHLERRREAGVSDG